MDQQKSEHELYQASYGSIFLRNFLVGFARALGGVAVQIVFFIFLFWAYQRFIGPQLSPLLDTLINSVERLENLQNSTQQIQFRLPENFNLNQ
jgi:hypothetical protein